MGGILGVDYGAVERHFRIYEVPKKKRKDLMSRIQLIEQGILSADAKRRDKARNRTKGPRHGR